MVLYIQDLIVRRKFKGEFHNRQNCKYKGITSVWFYSLLTLFHDGCWTNWTNLNILFTFLKKEIFHLHSGIRQISISGYTAFWKLDAIVIIFSTTTKRKLVLRTKAVNLNYYFFSVSVTAFGRSIGHQGEREERICFLLLFYCLSTSI